MEERSQHLARLVAISEQLSDGRTESVDIAEATVPADAVPQQPASILARMEVGLRPPPGVKQQDWRRARELFLRHSSNALGKLSRKDLSLSPDERAVMEAVIIADGSRPSFLLCRGRIDPHDPFMGDWGGKIATADANGLAEFAAAVGRIQPSGGHAGNFIGTGSLIDREKGLILTNYHVIKIAEESFGVAMRQDGNRIDIDDVLEIDFDGEHCSLQTRRFRIVEAWLPPGVGSTFSGVDAAVARIVPLDDGVSLPQAIPLVSADPSYVNGAKPNLAVVGFPGPPAAQDGEDVDWDFVIATLFGNRFGVKRAAPGRFTAPLGSHPRDRSAKRAIGHDATTFGGASGALVTSWLDAKLPCFAIHFGGSTEISNYALSFAVAQQALQGIGVAYG